ncbi:hypothetical protein TTMY_0808 [Thermus thermophilus]|nr:hypothetical protein TTMY_0808 [Thermus thermophilus]BDB11873.1 hypothetical protein TthTMY_16120 [Thermus thermophilus]
MKAKGASETIGSEKEVFPNSHVGEYAPALWNKNHAEASYLERREGVDGSALKENLAPPPGKTEESLKKGGLACPIRAEEGHHFPSPHLKIHAEQNLKRAIACLETCYFENFHTPPPV